jgi:PAS domain S-box-containing protein
VRNPLRRLRSVGTKVTWIIVLVSGIAVTAVSALAGIRSYQHLRAQSIETVASQARIVATFSSAAFAFWDRETAEEVLLALREVPGVERAYLTDRRGRQLADFSRTPEAARASPVLRPLGRWDVPGGYVHVVPVADRAGVHGRLQVEVRHGELRKEALAAALQSGLLSLAAIVLALALARTLHPLLTRPILRLEQAAQRVRDTGDYATRVPVEGEDELARLTEAFNEMLARIEHHETALRTAHQLTEESREQLELATDAADIGLWDVDLVADTLYWPPRVKRMFGISADRPVTMADFYQGLHPEDRERVTAAFATALDAGQRAIYDVEYRTIGREDGRTRWVAAKGRGLFDVDGRCVRVIGTAIDITARKASEQALRESEEQLRQADRRKDEFLAMLAHELRNPLAPISTASALLGRVADDPAKVQQASELIGRQVRHMTALVDDLLDVSRVTRGLIELEPTDVEMRGVVQSAIEQARPVIEVRQHRLDVEVAGDDIWVRGDRTRLVQSVANLLNNAAKYTPPGGRITLRLQRVADDVLLDVEDTGIGIGPDLLPSVFDLFVQGERTPDRSQGGLGIGLALVRALVDLHGGRIHARSDGPGCGSRFTIALPASARRTAGGATAAPGAARPSCLSVLVADDNVDAADSMSALLTEFGHSVDVAYTGTAAIACAASRPFDVYILDIGLPDMMGYQLIDRIKSAGVGEDAFFVAATGYGQQHDRDATRAAGFHRHLIKPVDPAHLLELLDRRAARSQA